jgi:hypothetical protein
LEEGKFKGLEEDLAISLMKLHLSMSEFDPIDDKSIEGTP